MSMWSHILIFMCNEWGELTTTIVPYEHVEVKDFGEIINHIREIYGIYQYWFSMNIMEYQIGLGSAVYLNWRYHMDIDTIINIITCQSSVYNEKTQVIHGVVSNNHCQLLKPL